MRQQLTIKQFSNFAASIWNSESYKAWDDSEKLWAGIAQQEFSRTFVHGFDYCLSELFFSPLDGRKWVYQTTSGTRLEVSQGVWHDEETGDLPEVQIWVEIPTHRENGNHSKLLASAVAGIDFYSWGSLYYSEEGTPERETARLMGMSVAADKPAKVLSTLIEEDWEEYDGADDDYDFDEEGLVNA